MTNQIFIEIHLFKNTKQCDYQLKHAGETTHPYSLTNSKDPQRKSFSRAEASFSH